MNWRCLLLGHLWSHDFPMCARKCRRCGINKDHYRYG